MFSCALHKLCRILSQRIPFEYILDHSPRIRSEFRSSWFPWLLPMCLPMMIFCPPHREVNGYRPRCTPAVFSRVLCPSTSDNLTSTRLQRSIRQVQDVCIHIQSSLQSI